MLVIIQCVKMIVLDTDIVINSPRSAYVNLSGCPTTLGLPGREKVIVVS